MPITESRVLFQRSHWVACIIAPGDILTVQSIRTGKGRAITGSAVDDWRKAFEEDSDLGSELCRALMG